MSVFDQLKTLSRSESLIAMEALWNQLRNAEDEPPSPEWHREELDRRDQMIEDGEAHFSSWEVAKNRVRDRVK
ncbi:MAG: addiction module protein [Verrucomicrobia bacterium]|nr:addiction module protein [Verrucomicrobiota bacterium]